MPPTDNPPDFDPSALAVLETAQRQYPGVPFLALGQTALWDEPMKAVWRRLLDAHYPEAELVAGVHDTDYFAKTAAHVSSDAKYVALPHDDGRTRDLWSAAGEMSSLFGSESVPTRALYRSKGVPFDALARDYPGGKDALYAEQTAAWGWRGIVSTESHDVVVHDISVQDVASALLEQLGWAFSESGNCLEGEARERARAVAAEITGWVTGFLQTCDANCRLSELYETLLPRLYQLLMNEPPRLLDTTSSTQLFQFNARTCHLPRFAVLDCFLNADTRAAACQCYNDAVSGSGIYALDAFGIGAIPFDVVIPKGGRGTLSLTRKGATIRAGGQTLPVPGGPVSTRAELAAVLETAFGPQVVLVGKAVTLPDMIGAEWLVVFHETASGYTSRTRAFNDALAQQGMTQALYPLVRLRYPTWDALSAVPESVVFRLPPHLAATFGRETIVAPQFAREWRTVADAQRRLLNEGARLRRTRDLLAYLEGKDGECWCDRLTEYEAALATLKGIAGHSATLGGRITEHRIQLNSWRDARQTLEKRMGEDWRRNILPLRERLRQAEAAGQDPRSLHEQLARQDALRADTFTKPLHELAERITATRAMMGEFRRQQRLLERGAEARAARATLADSTRRAQMAHLALVRNAFLTTEGLEHTQLRPTAWWLPLVDPSGEWLRAIVAGTQARLEPLVG